MAMKARNSVLFALSRASLIGLRTTIAVLVGPADANKDPVTPQQLQAYDEAFMEQVKKGDLLFHGDDATATRMGLRDVPSLCRRHPSASVPEVPGEYEQVRNAARHDQLVHREAQPG